MVEGVEKEVRYYMRFKETLLEALKPQMDVLRTFFKMDDVVTCATERFVSIAKLNRWSESQISVYILPYVMRAKVGLDRVLKEEDSWVGLYRDKGSKYPTIFEAPTIFMHDAVHWRQDTKLVTRAVLLDFMSHYPYVLCGRSKVDNPESVNVNDLLIMRGLLSDDFMEHKPIVGMYTLNEVKNKLGDIE